MTECGHTAPRLVLAHALRLAVAFVAFSLQAAGAAAQVIEEYSAARFDQLQAGNALILVDVHASWCSTCIRQKEVLDRYLEQHPEVPLHILRMDFGSQQREMRRFRATRQSTLILFRGEQRLWFSIAETRENVIVDALNAAAAQSGAALSLPAQPWSGSAGGHVGGPHDLPIRTAVVREQYRVAEVVGLRHWSVEMLQDSVARYLPGMSLFSNACASALQNGFGFPEAASIVVNNPAGQQRGRRNIVLLIEPQDSALVRHRDLPQDIDGSVAPWSDLVGHARTDPQLLGIAVQARIEAPAGAQPQVPASAAADGDQVRAIWRELEKHHTDADAAEARRTLESSPYVADRVAAAAILSGFDDADATWWALAGAALEPQGAVRELATTILRTLATSRPRPVDWTGGAEHAHALLNGSNLPFLTMFVRTLLSTDVQPSAAVPLLRGGGHGLLMLTMVDYIGMRQPAIDLLRTLSNEDYGDDATRWREWLAAL